MKHVLRALLAVVMVMVMALPMLSCGGGGGQDSAPVADAGPDQSVPTGSVVYLDGSGSSDPDGTPIIYSWSFDSTPPSSAAALSDPTVVNPTFTPDLGGTYVLSLVVSDGWLDSAPDTLTVTAMSPVPGMAIIPTGCFEMGDVPGDLPPDSDEHPVHDVCIAGFYMDVQEVTNAEYKACVDAGSCTSLGNTSSATRAPYYGNALYDDFPVIYVTWFQATEYCAWAGKRLPTEAEWEYAARGGLSGKRYPRGDAISGTDANYSGSGDPWDNDTSPVGYYAPNGYGLYDMAGNVREWVNDWYDDLYYGASPTNDPQGPASGSEHVLRGGGWSQATSLLRVSARYSYSPTIYVNSLGFRCARN